MGNGLGRWLTRAMRNLPKLELHDARLKYFLFGVQRFAVGHVPDVQLDMEDHATLDAFVETHCVTLDRRLLSSVRGPTDPIHWFRALKIRDGATVPDEEELPAATVAWDSERGYRYYVVISTSLCTQTAHRFDLPDCIVDGEHVAYGGRMQVFGSNRVITGTPWAKEMDDGRFIYVIEDTYGKNF